MPHLFSVEEANALIPRLTELLLALRERRDKLEAIRRGGAHHAGPSGNGHLDPTRQAEVRRGEDLAREINDLFSAITELGLELKGIDEGLVDFPSERDGRPVYLCWKLGEERVTFWHELDAGFAGRQPL